MCVPIDAHAEETVCYLGTAVETGTDNGCSDSKTIGEDSPHFGWDLGRFYVSGFTSKQKTADGSFTFLKKSGDKLALKFRLDKDIDALNLCSMARCCGPAALLTKVTYSNTKIKEPQKASMMEFIENVKVLLSALGCDVLTEAPQPDDSTVRLFCSTTQNASASDFVSEGGFTVLKGSRVSDVVAPSLKKNGSYDKLRSRLESDGVICDRMFVRDYEFSSPSAASTVVCGYPTSGNAKWQTAESVSLGDL